MCLAYAVGQIFTTLLATKRCSLGGEFYGGSTRRYFLVGLLPWILSFVGGVGGILMQIIGLFRTCKCTVSIGSWFKHNPPINLAMDTQEARDGGHHVTISFPYVTSFPISCLSLQACFTAFTVNPPTFAKTSINSLQWLTLGIIASTFVMLVSFVGWWHQKSIRNKFIGIVQDMIDMNIMELGEVARRNNYLPEEQEEEDEEESEKIPLRRNNRPRAATTPPRINSGFNLWDLQSSGP